MKQLIFASVCMLTFGTYSQEWHANGTLNNGTFGNKLGTSSPHPINIYTNGIHRAQFTTGNTLSS